MKKILVVGSTAYDLLLHYEGSFAESFTEETMERLSAAFVTPHFDKQKGGTAANIAWNLKLLGAEPLMVSTVGSDGTEYVRYLAEQGISTEYLEEVPDAFTATAIIGSDVSGRQIIFFHPGADAKGSLPDLSGIRAEIAYAIVSPRDATLMQKSVEWCHKNSIPVLFDPGQQLAAFSTDELKRMLKLSTGVICNDFEWSMLSGRLRLSEEKMMDIVDLLIITHGERGAEIRSGRDVISIQACTADRMVNPTGAGDAFRAGLLTGMTRGWTLEQAGQLGSALSSFVVELAGTQLDEFDLDVLHARVQKTFGKNLPQK